MIIKGHEQDYDFLKSKTTKVKKSEKDALKKYTKSWW